MKSGRGKFLAVSITGVGLLVLTYAVLLLREPAGRWWRWNKVLAFADRDLTRLGPREAEALQGLFSALGPRISEPQRLHAVISLSEEGGARRYALVCFPEPVLDRRHQKKVLLLDRSGNLLSVTPFSVGHPVFRMERARAPGSATDLILIHALSSKQFYAVRGDRILLVRIEDRQGNLSSQDEVIWPDRPWVPSRDWETRLKSGSWAERLALLTHIADEYIQYSLQAAILERSYLDAMAEEIRKLAHASDPWTSEAATRVLRVRGLPLDR